MKMFYEKGLKAMFCLLNTVNKTKQLSVKIFQDLLDKMISPIILYNYEIWGASFLKKKNYSEQNLVENLFHLYTVPSRRSANEIHENCPGCKF